LVYSSTNLLKLSINFPNLLHNILNMTWTTPFLNCRYLSMCVHTSHWPYGYPFLTLCSWQWAHKNPWCSLQHLCYHCVGCYFHMGWEQLHALFSNTLIPLVNKSKDGICTFVNIDITNPTQANLLPQSCATQGFVAFVPQVKEWSYSDWPFTDQFLPLIVEVFGCLFK